MEGKIRARDSTAAIIVVAVLLFVNSGVYCEPGYSIKKGRSYEECYTGCIPGCVTTPLWCGLGCQRACHACAPDCRAEDISSLSLYCNVGCSINKCANFKGDAKRLESCLSECSEVSCKI